MLFNPNRVVTNCELCLEPYLIVHHPALETIPDDQSYISFILRYPLVLSLLIHYMWLLHATFTETMTLEIHFSSPLYVYYQYLFQIFYFICLRTQWEVKNRRIYFHELKSRLSFLFLLLHMSLLTGVHMNYPLAGPIMNMYIVVFWQWHVSLLHRVNHRILGDES